MPGVTSEFEAHCLVRDAREHDLKFIKSTWSKGLFHGSDWYQAIPKDIFFPSFERIMAVVFSRPNLWIKLVVIKEEPDAICGYVIAETNPNGLTTVHWLYVKPAWRRMGIGSILWPEGTSQVTHMTKIGKSILRKLPNVIFNPFFN